MQTPVPVITVDGPSGSGKGTLSRRLAEHLGWHFLDSGALYRVLALAALKQGIALDSKGLSLLAHHLAVEFDKQSSQIFLSGENITLAIRTEKCGAVASVIAAIPEVRAALLERQRAFCQLPGLVADGRDMGTVVFPQAILKIFLEASPEERAKRRQMQLKEQGFDASLEHLFIEIAERDARDRQRPIAPLHPASDAVILDSTTLSIEGVLAAVLKEVERRGITAFKYTQSR